MEEESEELSEFSESLPELSDSDSEKLILCGLNLLGETNTSDSSSFEERTSDTFSLGEVIRCLLGEEDCCSVLSILATDSSVCLAVPLVSPTSSPLELVVRLLSGSKLLIPKWKSFPRSILMTFCERVRADTGSEKLKMERVYSSGVRLICAPFLGTHVGRPLRCRVLRLIAVSITAGRSLSLLTAGGLLLGATFADRCADRR